MENLPHQYLIRTLTPFYREYISLKKRNDKSEFYKRLHKKFPRIKNIDSIRATLSIINKKFNISSITQNKKEAPKILVLDIETAPMVSYVWGCYKQNISPEFLIHDTFMLSWSAKWLMDLDIKYDVVTPNEALKRDDKRITKSIYNLINKADVVIAHNGLNFDKKILNTRFLIHGLSPALPYEMVDTCLIFRKQFRFASNKLDYLNKELGLERKIHTGGFKLWIDCLGGDKKSLEKMVGYNRGDVAILEENYFIIRPYIKNHPNLALYGEIENESVCPNCKSHKIKFTKAFYYTNVNKYQTFRCECGFVGRQRITSLTKKDKENLVTTIAR